MTIHLADEHLSMAAGQRDRSFRELPPLSVTPAGLFRISGLRGAYDGFR